MQQVGSHSDPAPSRWSYRFQRLMLTPLYRTALRVGVPFVLALGIGSAYLGQEHRREAINAALVDLRYQIQNRPEFMVNMMAIDGASPEVAEDIRDVVALDFPQSSFDIGLEAIRAQIAELSAVKEVRARIRTGGVLQIDVIERTPVVFWRTRAGLEWLDSTGFVVRPIDTRKDRADLPVIAGDGADKAVAEALALVRAAGPLSPRMRGLVRMGARRWDVVLDRDQRIMLPVANPVQALERVIALSQAQDMLNRDLAVVDMRLAARPTIRMTQAATEQWWKIKDMTLGTNK